MAGGTYSKVKTVISGETITASDRNAEHDNHITNMNFAGLGDISANNTEFQTTVDPFPSSSESLPTDGKGELERLRFQILQIGKAISRATGFTQWYHDFPNPADPTTIIDIDNTRADGDPGIAFSLSGTRKWTTICDDGDSDKYKIGTTAGGTSTRFTIDASELVINDPQADFDFRVEGDTETNLFVCDASTDRIGIGIATPDNLLHIFNATAGTMSASANAILTLENSTTCLLEFMTPNSAAGGISFSDPDTSRVGEILYNHNGNFFSYSINSTEFFRMDVNGNFMMGVTTAVTSAEKTIHIVNGTAPSANLTNGVVLYAEDVTASSELKVRDEAGNATVLSPHDPLTGDWIFHSRNDNGTEVKVNMEKFIRRMEQLTGETFFDIYKRAA